MLLSALAAMLAAAVSVQAQVPFADLERRIADAMLAKDGRALTDLIDETFVMRGAPDRDRAAWMNAALTGCWGSRVDLDDVSVRFAAADLAIVTLQSTFYVDPATCGPAIVRSLITDTWRRGSDGAWRLAVRHASAPGGLASQFARLDPPPAPFEGRVHLSYLTTRGNTRTASLAGGIDATWRAGAWTTTGAISALSADSDGDAKARKTAAELRAARKVRDRLSLFGRAAGLRDRFAGIESQLTLSGGASLSAALPSPHTLDLDFSAGYLDENRVSEARKRSMTGDLGARYAAKLTATLSLLDAALVIVDLQEPADWRLRNQLGFDIALWRRLSIGLSHTLDYRHRPIAGFRGLDQSLSTALVMTF